MLQSKARYPHTGTSIAGAIAKAGKQVMITMHAADMAQHSACLSVQEGMAAFAGGNAGMTLLLTRSKCLRLRCRCRNINVLATANK